MVYPLYRMGSKQMFLAFVCVCGFAWIFYYKLLQSSAFTVTGRPYMSVNGVVSLTGILSVSQQQLEIGHKDRVRFMQVQLPQRKTTVQPSLLHTDTTISASKEVENSVDNLEVYTISRLSKDKLIAKFGSDKQLDEKFLRNDERSIERIVDGLEVYATQDGKVFQKKGLPTKRFPTIIIIGVKKGGTRALLEILKLHPQICACGPEIHFFDRHYSKGLPWYRDKMPLCYENEASVEKTPSYFVTNGVARDMFAYSKSLNHTLKLLVIVRDPTTRAISDYTQTQYKMQLKGKAVGKLGSFEELALKVTNDGQKFVNSRWGAIKIGVYSKHLKRWLKYFTPEQLHVVSGESLVNEPYREVKKVERFLGLPSFIKPAHFVYNETKKFYCFDRSLSYRDSETLRPTSIPLRCLGTSKGRSHAKISNETKQLLIEFYKPFNKELYDMTGRDFGWQ